MEKSRYLRFSIGNSFNLDPDGPDEGLSGKSMLNLFPFLKKSPSKGWRGWGGLCVRDGSPEGQDSGFCWLDLRQPGPLGTLLHALELKFLIVSVYANFNYIASN